MLLYSVKNDNANTFGRKKHLRQVIFDLANVAQTLSRICRSANRRKLFVDWIEKPHVCWVTPRVYTCAYIHLCIIWYNNVAQDTCFTNYEVSSWQKSV